MSTTGMTVTFPDSHLTVTTDHARLTVRTDDGKPARLTSDQLNHVMAVLRDVACDLQGAR